MVRDFSTILYIVYLRRERLNHEGSIIQQVDYVDARLKFDRHWTSSMEQVL